MSTGLVAKVNSLLLHRASPTASSKKTILLLAAVIRPPELPIPEPYPFEIEQLSGQLMNDSHTAVSKYLSEMKERLSVESETCVVKNDSVSSAIHELINQKDDIDLVVLCAHGRTGQSTWPYGSVARNYMEHGTKPVLVIQDIHYSQVKPSAAEMAAKKSSGR
jgi:nucleotide-binding universal stress UspA family protein